MAEAVMNDARQTFVMFCPDFCHAAYRPHPLYDKMVTAFAPPLQGVLPPLFRRLPNQV